GEDFEKYPRDLERDANLAREAGVDVIFSPSHRDVYPADYRTYVNVEGLTENLCGLSRPGHFRGVTTICLKLFNIVKPHVAIFGKKDFQQFMTIKKMVEDLNLDLEIVGCDTVREMDGLAMSSRNAYLKAEERQAALSLSQSLVRAKQLYEGGERKAAAILAEVEATVRSHPVNRIDYAKICTAADLRDAEVVGEGDVIALAVKVGATRLIDNYVFGENLDIPKGA
ncbi:MAG: pantoate--beta-alanine ligase, partial [Smithellaceae bacterium]|nr:pantoate--beta-alanine ligase [Smithellaceae bacterium]